MKEPRKLSNGINNIFITVKGRKKKKKKKKKSNRERGEINELSPGKEGQ